MEAIHKSVTGIVLLLLSGCLCAAAAEGEEWPSACRAPRGSKTAALAAELAEMLRHGDPLPALLLDLRAQGPDAAEAFPELIEYAEGTYGGLWLAENVTRSMGVAALPCLVYALPRLSTRKARFFVIHAIGELGSAASSAAWAVAEDMARPDDWSDGSFRGRSDDLGAESAEVLGRLGIRGVRAALGLYVEGLGNRDADLQGRALQAIGSSGDAGEMALGFLMQRLREGRDTLRILQTLGRLGRVARSILPELTQIELTADRDLKKTIWRTRQQILGPAQP